MTNSNNSRVIDLTVSEGNVNDAFTSLFLSTGYLQNDEVIKSITFHRDTTENPLKGLLPMTIEIAKEVQTSRPV